MSEVFRSLKKTDQCPWAGNGLCRDKQGTPNIVVAWQSVILILVVNSNPRAVWDWPVYCAVPNRDGR